MKYGERLRFLREEAGFSQDDVARSLRLDGSTVSQWECNRRHPHLKMAKLLAGIFGVSMDFFVENLGASLYNAALDRARAWFTHALGDLEVDYDQLYRRQDAAGGQGSRQGFDG